MESVKNNQVEEIESQEAFNRKLAVAITTAIEVETALKLYSYRCLGAEMFVQRIEQITTQIHKLRK